MLAAVTVGSVGIGVETAIGKAGCESDGGTNCMLRSLGGA
jgi:hypothetical protein